MRVLPLHFGHRPGEGRAGRLGERRTEPDCFEGPVGTPCQVRAQDVGAALELEADRAELREITDQVVPLWFPSDGLDLLPKRYHQVKRKEGCEDMALQVVAHLVVE